MAVLENANVHEDAALTLPDLPEKALEYWRLPEAEQARIYGASESLCQFGTACFVAGGIALLGAGVTVCNLDTLGQVFWLVLLACSVIAFAFGWEARSLRTESCRRLIRLLTFVISVFTLRYFASGKKVRAACEVKELFAEDGLTHRQITYLWRCHVADEMPSSQELPESRQPFSIFGLLAHAIVLVSPWLFVMAVGGLISVCVIRDNAVSSGRKHLDDNDEQRAFQKFELAARLGSEEGEFLLGQCYAEGIGCKQDIRRALALLNKPEILKASPYARVFVGYCMLEGEHLRKNVNRGFEMLSDPEVADEPGARLLLGMCYLQGVGTPQNFDKAAELLQRAADGGDEEALKFLGYENGKRPEWPVPLPQLLREFWKENPTPFF